MLTGDKIVLRPICYDDWEKTLKWRNDLFLKSSTMSHPFPVTQEMEKKWYEETLSRKDNSFIPFSLIGKDSNQLLGYFSLNNINWISRIAFVSGLIGEKKDIGKGIGKEAVELLLKYAFEHLNLQKVCAYVIQSHPALNTWISTGAKIEGTLHNHFFTRGKYVDVAFLAWFE